MPSPYDYDLRLKAIAAVERGEKKLRFVDSWELVEILLTYG